MEPSPHRGGRIALVVVAFLALALPGRASADSLSEYKETKHGDSAGSSESGGDDDDSGESGGDEDSEGFWEALFSGSSDDDWEEEEHSSGQSSGLFGGSDEEAAAEARGPKACRFDHFHHCIRRCRGDREVCRRDCRQQADWICGTDTSEAEMDEMSARRGDPAGTPSVGDGVRPFRGQLEAGIGGVEGGFMVTTQSRMRWGAFGVGHQLSWMGSRTDSLVEGDIGPAIFTQSGGVRAGLRPSLMLSFGNAVRTRVGAGVRWHVGLRGGDLSMSLSPMTGIIHGRFNLHMRSAVGLRLGSKFYLKGGHDYRYVRNLANGKWSGMHGGFAAVGWRTW